jgi:hypothetical protein
MSIKGADGEASVSSLMASTMVRTPRRLIARSRCTSIVQGGVRRR